jgi:hypothetical protein
MAGNSPNRPLSAYPVNEACQLTVLRGLSTNGFAIPAAVPGVQPPRGFRITIFDERTRGDNSKPRLERVLAAKLLEIA